ncbi:putative cyclase [Actinacidiphila reveromycinica]|uniref:Putative cyclase n=1 Tax=Actinacidiphila reveromycinica TaxID=659352 RepID=A0A7U3UN20_9ACTN|nr:cyclase family protein [Streptomyces sp. SN-593]BBA97275.1 putative cyclase [Streptomyces sp. SN-593]
MPSNDPTHAAATGTVTDPAHGAATDAVTDPTHGAATDAVTDPTHGAATAAVTTALLAGIARGVRTVDLGQPLFTGMPCSPNHPGFRMALTRRHGDTLRPDGGSASSELIVTGGHVGTHIDALAHVSHDGRLHGGVDAAAAQAGGSFARHGAEHIPPLVTRAVLLDVAAVHGVDVLPAGYGVTRQDLADAAERAGVLPGPGDVALVRTGWARTFADPVAYLGHASGVPGVTVEAAGWLAARAVAATGADTTAYEQIPAGDGHRVLPVHRLLLVEHGIYLMEHLNLEQAAAEGLTEFVIVVAPLRIVGGTGSPIRPVAVVGA